MDYVYAAGAGPATGPAGETFHFVASLVEPTGLGQPLAIFRLTVEATSAESIATHAPVQTANLRTQQEEHSYSCVEFSQC